MPIEAPSPRARAAVSWSAGKDSCLAWLRAREAGWPVATLLTMFEAEVDASTSHAVPQALVQAQADAMGCALRVGRAGAPGDANDYARVFAAELGRLRATGHTHLLCGDIDLQAHRDWVSAQCDAAGLAAVFPLWGEARASLARAVLQAPVQALVVCVDTRWLDASYCAVPYDEVFLARLPEGVCPVGEEGEFHTFVAHAPGFAQAVPWTLREVVTVDSRPPMRPTRFVQARLA